MASQGATHHRAGVAASHPPRRFPERNPDLSLKSGGCGNGKLGVLIFKQSLGSRQGSAFFFLRFGILWLWDTQAGWTVFPLLGQSGLGVHPTWFGAFCPPSQQEVCVWRDISLLVDLA